ncbi:FHA domain-containing protein [Phormidesmis priestleyi]
MMSTYFCPKGHESTESDYCSECGAKIGSVSEVAPSVVKDSTPVITSSQLCPDCSALHELGSGNFCEICGYNFTTGAHGELPVTISSSDPQGVAPIPEVPTTKQGGEEKAAIAWEVVVTIDSVPHHPDSPPPPDLAPMTIRLDKTAHLIGRTSQIRAIYPEIALNVDDAVSHRHALIECQSDGDLTLRDIGSANGTELNGVEIKPMTDIRLKNADEITIGHWTRIQVKAV